MGRKIAIFILSFAFILVSSAVVFGQYTPTIGEYQLGLTKNGEVYTYVGNDGGYVLTKTTLSKIKQGGGGQYTTCYLDSTGRFFVLNGNSTTVSEHSTTTTADTLRPDDIDGFWRSYFALKDGEIWYLPRLEDEMKQNGDATSSTWMKLTQPSGGRTITKMVSGATTGFSLAFLIVLCSDGTVWQYTRASTTPTQLTWPTGNTNAIDIAQMGGVATLIVTPTGAHTRGYLASMLGGSDLSQAGSFVDVSANFAAAARPWKQVAGAYYWLHVVDANNELYSIGNNMQGVFGTGDMYPSWRTYWYSGSPSAYIWSWANGERVTNTLTKVQGAKVKRVVTHNAIAPYVWAEDMGGNWYTWGRNKGPILGNGIVLTVADQAARSEYYNVPAPRKVDPFANPTFGPQASVDTAALRLPIANAGIDQYLTSGTASTTLYGNGSHQQQPGQTTTVTMSYSWTKVSGPSCTITSPTSQSTGVTGMSAGTYVFRNTVTSSHGSDYQDVTVTIPAAEETPSCNCIIGTSIITN
ncbi:MAG TPA: hypothetical protein PKY29_04415 [Ferruginibacter sp.]|nr:hypothetical protein [Ferruginibacter sp.]HRQ20532.1 hypothetical protein [Ferruginibacter sp.]